MRHDLIVPYAVINIYPCISVKTELPRNKDNSVFLFPADIEPRAVTADRAKLSL